METTLIRLQDKVALITGGNGGIGRSIAERAVAAGAKVVITARDVARGEETAQALRHAGGECIFVPADLRGAPGDRAHYCRVRQPTRCRE
jgi:NAD(P)-dependent dehydrogenase (short-subunit alcohol dehydrogenase family)